MPKLKGPDLERLYLDSEALDNQKFAEYRTNVLLVAGDHYSQHRSQFFNRVRHAKDITRKQKIRLTKNHTQRICKDYTDTILSSDPGIGFRPKNGDELQDKKSAELHRSVWRDAVVRQNWDKKKESWCDSFVEIGEVTVKCFWDEDAGKLIGFEPKRDKDEEPELDENGKKVPDLGRPVFEGDLVFEEILGFNLLRPVESQSMEDAEWLCVRKMVNKKTLKHQFPDMEEVMLANSDRTYMIFDADTKGYKKTDTETMVKEFYFRPSPTYPKGYFYITIQNKILAEGPLPGGIFPIAYAPYDKIKTTARGVGPVNVMRPYQIEVNRMASKIAEHQITMGDDKLLIQNGTKISAGASLPGIRTVNYTGMAPTVMQGRPGDQYIAPMQQQIQEMYSVMGVDERKEDKPSQGDAFDKLFRTASEKKRFQRPIRRFNRFLVDLAKVYLQLAKVHFSPERLIPIAGKNEHVNISEFTQLGEMQFDVIVEPQSEDLETKMGRQLALNQVIQFTGSNLQKSDIGRLIKNMPFANLEDNLEDFTMDEDSANNMMLALDRGEDPGISEYDDAAFMVKKLVAKMRKPEFTLLDPQIQENYPRYVRTYQQVEQQKLERLKAMESELIPVDGPLVAVEFYVQDPNDPEKAPKRARIPHNSVRWLLDRIEKQGNTLEQLEVMGEEAMSQLQGLQGQQQGVPSQ